MRLWRKARISLQRLVPKSTLDAPHDKEFTEDLTGVKALEAQKPSHILQTQTPTGTLGIGGGYTHLDEGTTARAAVETVPATRLNMRNGTCLVKDARARA